MAPPRGVSIRTYWPPLGGVNKNLLAPPKNYHVNAGVGAFQLILEYQMVSVGGQILTKDKRPPSLCRQCTAVVFLGLTNTCCNRNGWGCTPSTPQKLHQVHPQEVAPQKLHPGVKARGAGGGRGVHPLYTSIQKLHPGTKAKGAGVGGCPLYTWVQKLHRILVWGLKVKNLSMGEKRDLSSKMSFWGPQVVIFIKMPKDLQKQHYTFHVKSEYIHYGRTLYNPISQKNACTTRCFLHDIA